MEQIYTIPINEVFEQTIEEGICACPICRLKTRLEENELDLILGASMMEPDIRIKTNEQGFCEGHYAKMMVRKNRLGLGLMLQSHLDEVKKNMKDGLLGLLPAKKGEGVLKYLEKLEGSCYICGRVDYHMERMCANLAQMYAVDATFRQKSDGQPYFCLPHLRLLGVCGKRELHGKSFAAFWDAVTGVNERYLASLKEDVDWFCRKFDYRYADEPWGNAKDAVPRAADFLCGTDGVSHSQPK